MITGLAIIWLSAVGVRPMTQPQTNSNPHSLAGVAIFASLTPSSLASAEKRCAWRNYEPGELIIDYLDKSDDVYFIVSGEARASVYSLDGKAITFCDLAPGEMFGEFAAIDGAPRSAGIEARTRCLAASMQATTFRGLLHSEPVAAMALMRHFVTKIRALTTRVYEFSALAVNNRIQAELLRLAVIAPRAGKAAEIDPAPIHADIASRTSTHREAVARELSRLSKLGIIERRGHSLVVKDIDRLTAMVHEVTGE
jgi:CRP/FNR family cyclic AMP-dependent transcriptional regulator